MFIGNAQYMQQDQDPKFPLKIPPLVSFPQGAPLPLPLPPLWVQYFSDPPLTSTPLPVIGFLIHSFASVVDLIMMKMLGRHFFVMIIAAKTCKTEPSHLVFCHLAQKEVNVPF